MTLMLSHYKILGLPEVFQNDSSLPAQTFRAAYRRALLQNHPDKSHDPMNSSVKLYSIDQITEAFSILSDSKSRAKYDSDLKLQQDTKSREGKQVFHTGIETLDLDDLEFDGNQAVWFLGCRCGDHRGFLVKEHDLEEAASEGEISVGCRGCSLWIRVLFGVIEAHDDTKDAVS